MIVKYPKGLQAYKADRMARAHYQLREDWQRLRLPQSAEAMATMQARRETYQARTGWVADHDGETTTYHYTNPAQRERIGDHHE